MTTAARRPSNSSSTLSPAQRAEVLRLAEVGCSQEVIVKRTGVSQGVVGAILRARVVVSRHPLLMPAADAELPPVDVEERQQAVRSYLGDWKARRRERKETEGYRRACGTATADKSLGEC